MINNIDTPALFLENIILGTYQNKILWIPTGLMQGSKYTALITIPPTKKSIKIEMFDMGNLSFIKSEFSGMKEKVEFKALNAQDHPMRMSRLIQSIKTQLKEENIKI